MNNVLNTHLKNTLGVVICLLLVSAPGVSSAVAIERFLDASPDTGKPPASLQVAQSNGMTLSQAVDSVRRSGNVERVISAQTRVSGGREVHHIKVLTKDGKVRTHKIQGRKRN